MQAEIAALYGCKYVYGPYQGLDKRRRCVLHFQGNKTISKAYARLVMEAALGRKLNSGEHVDHIDGDKSNDALWNLQVLSDQDHRIKTAMESSARQCQKLTLACPICGADFKASRYRAKRTDAVCCSKPCARRFKWRNGVSSGRFVAEGGGVEPPRRY